MKFLAMFLMLAFTVAIFGCTPAGTEPTTQDRIPVGGGSGDRIPVKVPTDPAPTDPAQQELRFKIPRSLSDNCVLQQNSTVNIWGSCTGEGEMKLTFNGKEYTTYAKDGAFNFRVDTPAGSLTTYEIVISSAYETKTIRNVAVGEVFLMGGQSNMAFYNIQLTERPPEATDGGNPYIRFTNTVPYAGLVTEPMEIQGNWYVTGNNTFDGMGAFSSWFGRRMFEELQVPIGLVSCAMSDSTLAAWLTREDAAGLDRENVSISEPYHPHTPGQLYNTVLYSYLNYTFRAAVWYQGESSNHGTYEQNLTHFINCWRKYLNDPDLPFVIVQLPGYGTYDDWPTARQAQKNVADTLENVAYSVNIDLGEEKDVHPQDKKPAAQRAADVMLNLAFGRDLPEAAKFVSATKSGDAVTVTFSHGGGLHMKKGAAGLEIRVGGKWTAVDAGRVTVFDGGLTVSGAAEATALRYAWASWPTVSLFNGAGLPAEPFMAEFG